MCAACFIDASQLIDTGLKQDSSLAQQWHSSSSSSSRCNVRCHGRAAGAAGRENNVSQDGSGCHVLAGLRHLRIRCVHTTPVVRYERRKMMCCMLRVTCCVFISPTATNSYLEGTRYWCVRAAPLRVRTPDVCMRRTSSFSHRCWNHSDATQQQTGHQQLTAMMLSTTSRQLISSTML